MQRNSQGIGLSSIVGAILVFRIDVICRVATRPDFSGSPDFQPMCPASRQDPCRDVYVPIFWSKKLIVCLNDSGIIDTSGKMYKNIRMETFFAQLFLSLHCTAAVQPVARLLNFVFAYFLRLVYKTITFLLASPRTLLGEITMLLQTT